MYLSGRCGCRKLAGLGAATAGIGLTCAQVVADPALFSAYTAGNGHCYIRPGLMNPQATVVFWVGTQRYGAPQYNDGTVTPLPAAPLMINNMPAPGAWGNILPTTSGNVFAPVTDAAGNPTGKTVQVQGTGVTVSPMAIPIIPPGGGTGTQVVYPQTSQASQLVPVTVQPSTIDTGTPGASGSASSDASMTQNYSAPSGGGGLLLAIALAIGAYAIL